MSKTTPPWDRWPNLRWLFVLFMVVMAALLIGMVVWATRTGLESRRESSPIEGGERITGAVVELRSDDDTTYEARVEFTDRDGRVHRFWKLAGDDKPSLGDQVEVSYDPDDPSEARDLTTNKDIWKYQLLPGVVFAAVAVFVLPVSLILYFRRRRGDASA